MKKCYFVGVDGGGTKTALIALTANGETFASAVCGPLNYNFIGTEQALKNLEAGVAALNLPKGSIAAVGIGDPSVDDVAESAASKQFLARATALFEAPVYLRSDAYMTLFALTGGKRTGVLTICGTGAMAIGENAEGKILVAGGWGRLTGDEGSGYYIGREGICAALRAADGVAPKTALTEAVLAYFKVPNARALISVFYGGEEPDVAGFSRCVATCAEAGDEIARGILLDAAAHLSRYAIALMTACRTELLGVWGSVLCKNQTVRQAFEAGVRQKIPHADICLPNVSAQHAAALYAAQQVKESERK